MKPRFWLYLLVIGAVAGFFGYAVMPNFRRLDLPTNPDRVIVYATQPTRARDDDPAAAAGRFHGYPILGQVEVTDPAVQADILAKVQEGVWYGGQIARCFNPRHGVRVTSGNRTVDVGICFECSYVVVHDGGSRTVHPTTNAAKNLLNRVLSDAGIPLAPE